MEGAITRVYANFRGVDFRGEEVNLLRSPDSLNMWKDYRFTDSIRTRPKLELAWFDEKTQIQPFNDTVYGIFYYNGDMITHVGEALYLVAKSSNGGYELTRLWEGLNRQKSSAFVYDGKFYFKDGKVYLQCGKNNDGTVEAKEVVGYIPTTTINGKRETNGTRYEDVNYISPYRINTFYRDGSIGENNKSVYWLDAQEIDEDFKPEVEIFSVKSLAYEPVSTPYAVDYKNGHIIFDTEPALSGEDSVSPTVGQDDMRIKFKRTVPGYREKILNCTILQVFDNRVFVSGNPDSANTVYHCSLNDPSYFSDQDRYREGMDDSPVRGMVAGNNALWVFREPSDANTTVFYHTPTTDDDYGKIYPSSHSSVTTGCIGAAINFNDDIVFFSERGMEGIDGDITTEQVVEHRSTLVDRKLISEKNYRDMILEEWNGYLLVFIGNKVYLADSRTAFTNEDHIEYDWFYWEFDKSVTCAKVYKDVLFVGTEDGIYSLTDGESPLESYWVTPKDKFKSPNRLKTTNKRGCVAEAEGDVSVYAKVEDSEFELIGEHKGVTDYFVSRIKRKKFKDIQLKFYSNTKFSLESVTLECLLGGYIKR